MADRLAVALEHARLAEQVREGHEQARVLSRRLIEAQEAERRHIARRRATRSGRRSAVKINMQAAQRLSESAAPLLAPHLQEVAVAEHALERVRDLSLSLRPSLLDDFGLAEALGWYVERQARWAGIAARFAADPLPARLCCCPPRRRASASPGEALTNVIRHARAGSVEVSLRRRGEEGSCCWCATTGSASTWARRARGAPGSAGHAGAGAAVSGRLRVTSSPGRRAHRGVRALPPRGGELMKPIRVLLADDHALVRAGMRALLGRVEGIEVVAEAGDGREALRLIGLHRPDVVLMDISMAGMGGLEAAAEAAKAFPQVRVIMLSMHAGEAYVLQALRAGAAGYLLKDAGTQELESALRTVAGGGTYLTPSVSGHVVAGYVRRAGEQAAPAPSEPLTPRQREVLGLIARGHSTREIARLLFVSVKTVQTHRAELMNRLGIGDVAGLVRYAMRRGLVAPEE